MKINGTITEVYTDYFCEEENRYYVDCYWEADDESLDTKYAVGDSEDDDTSRGASMAYVSADGTKVEYKEEFKDVCFNSSLIQEAINDLVRTLQNR